MDVLILGGTGFVGRHIALAATSAGMDVTLFNRGTKPDVPPAGMSSLIGDRDGGLDALEGRRFDAVVDVSGYLPRLVAASAELLAPSVGRYLFISTISVYDLAEDLPFRDEDAPLGVLDEPLDEQITNATYGPLKVACEEAVTRTYGEARTTIVRPTVVVGPFDPSDRFTYWVRRVATGGRLLAPGSRSDPTQWIDARDLGEFVVKLLAESASGVFNAATPPDSRTMGGLLDRCEEAGAASAAFAGRRPSEAAWASAGFLEQHQVVPFRDMPLWLPSGHDSLMRVSVERATAAGLRHRADEQTVADTLAWDVGRGLPPLKAGLTPEREAELLALLA